MQWGQDKSNSLIIKFNMYVWFTILRIDDKVIKPAIFVLGENVLKLLKEDINGMIYFLTGNCHIKWE